MRSSLLLALLLLVGVLPLGAAVTLVPTGSTWIYFAQGSVPTNWNQLLFDDSSWPAGAAQLGWGDGDEQTAIARPEAMSTVYFRHVFDVTNKASLSHLTSRIVGDDGVIVYLNGTEVARRNLPIGPVTPNTPAVANLETNENAFFQRGIAASLLLSNANVLAVELHQHPEGQHDGSFDLELLANVVLGLPNISITRPSDGSVFPSGPILFETAHDDPDGHVTRVYFYTNDVFMAEVAQEPFSYLWNSPPPGRYRVTVEAYDNFSYHKASAPVNLQAGSSAGPLNLLRGPYLQSGSPTGVVVRWRTDWLSDSVVRYGSDAGALVHSTTNGAITAEHEVRLGNLDPGTLYYYSIGSSSQAFPRPANFKFRTSPTNARPTRIWVIGDSGTADRNASNVFSAYLSLTGSQPTDLWLMLGDNAYGVGSDAEYQRAVFDMYRELLPQTVVWPALGNHDAGDSDFGDTTPYRSIFTLPTNAESGGMASGSELYYSFDYGNVHFVCLDAFTTDRSVGGPMLTWLRSDLAATDKDWIIGFWHHPPYSWGTHDSDEDRYQTEMRERAGPILEEFGVDLVLCGHSHVYERTFLLNGHYGRSSELQSWMVRDGSLGRADTGGFYQKPAGGLGGNRGTVYVVCGCSGAGGEGLFPKHPAMAVNSGGFGSLIIEVDALRMNTRFLRDQVKIGDYFTIDKSALSTDAPQARIERWQEGARISWPTSRPAYRLEQAGSLPVTNWTPVSNTVGVQGRRRFVDVPTNLPTRFFRLKAEPPP